MSDKEIRFILIAYFKGFAHAFLMPITLMVLVNHYSSGNYGGVVALIYVFAFWVIYKNSTNRDLSKDAFNKTLLALLVFVLIILINVFMGAFK